jgi:hypothetical protein
MEAEQVDREVFCARHRYLEDRCILLRVLQSLPAKTHSLDIILSSFQPLTLRLADATAAFLGLCGQHPCEPGESRLIADCAAGMRIMMNDYPWRANLPEHGRTLRVTRSRFWPNAAFKCHPRERSARRPLKSDADSQIRTQPALLHSLTSPMRQALREVATGTRFGIVAAGRLSRKPL